MPCSLGQPRPPGLVLGAPRALSQRILVAKVLVHTALSLVPAGQATLKVLQRADVAKGTFAGTLLHLTHKGSAPAQRGCFSMVMGRGVGTNLEDLGKAMPGALFFVSLTPASLA